MMDIFICEDHPQEAAEYAAIIKGELKTAKDKGRLTYTSADAESLLAYLERHPVKRGLYFLHSGIDERYSACREDPGNGSSGEHCLYYFEK